MALYLAVPARRHRRAWNVLNRAFRQEENRIASIGNNESYRRYLRKCRNYAAGRRLPKGYVPASTFFLVEESGSELLGVINIRHRLNDHLLNNPGGHIGYAVAPGERRKGYGAEQLRLALEICRDKGINPVLVTCNKDNIASARVIRKNGGVLEDERLSEEGRVFQRYWITL